MLTLKLQRLGKSKEPFFRLIVQEKAKNPQSKALEILGWLNPRTKKRELKKERIAYWLSVGAQTTATVHNLLVRDGLIKGPKMKTVKISQKRRAKMAVKDGKEIKAAESEAKKESSGEVLKVPNS